MKAYCVIAKGVGELHGEKNTIRCLLFAVVCRCYCDQPDQVAVQNNERPRSDDFQMHTLWSIEHVDRFVGMAGTPTS